MVKIKHDIQYSLEHSADVLRLVNSMRIAYLKIYESIKKLMIDKA